MQGSLKHSVVISACSCWHRNTAMFCKDRSTVQAISGRGLIWLEIVDCDIDQIKIITREDYENGRIINSKSYKDLNWIPNYIYLQSNAFLSRSVIPPRQVISKYLIAKCTCRYDVIMINFDALQLQREAELKGFWR